MILKNKQQFSSENVYFSSDFHLNHKNICSATSTWKSGTRDFCSVEAMNDAIISSVNETVPEDCVLFYMGDFNFGDKAQTRALRDKINCREIHFIYGNHDEHIRRNPEMRAAFSSCQDFAEILVDRQLISLFHYPMKVWNKAHHGAYALTGHSHGSLPYSDGELGIDVGWCVWRKPLSFQEVRDVLRPRRFVPVDHHNETTT